VDTTRTHGPAERGEPGWVRHVGVLVFTVAGMVAAGAGLFALVLPFEAPLDDGASSVDCSTPLASAFDDAAGASGWFAYAPDHDDVQSLHTYCVSRSRTRASWGAVALVGGLVVAGTAVRSGRPS